MKEFEDILDEHLDVAYTEEITDRFREGMRQWSAALDNVPDIDKLDAEERAALDRMKLRMGEAAQNPNALEDKADSDGEAESPEEDGGSEEGSEDPDAPEGANDFRDVKKVENGLTAKGVKKMVSDSLKKVSKQMDTSLDEFMKPYEGTGALNLVGNRGENVQFLRGAIVDAAMLHIMLKLIGTNQTVNSLLAEEQEYFIEALGLKTLKNVIGKFMKVQSFSDLAENPAKAGKYMNKMFSNDTRLQNALNMLRASGLNTRNYNVDKIQDLLQDFGNVPYFSKPDIRKAGQITREIPRFMRKLVNIGAKDLGLKKSLGGKIREGISSATSGE